MPTLTLTPTLSRLWASSAANYAEARLGQGSVSVLYETSTLHQIAVGQSLVGGLYYVALQVLLFDTAQLVGKTIVSAKLVIKNLHGNTIPAGMQVRFGVGTGLHFVSGPLLPTAIGSFTPVAGHTPVVEVPLTLSSVAQQLVLLGFCNRFASGVPPAAFAETVAQDSGAPDNVVLVVEYAGTEILGPFVFSDAASQRFTAMHLVRGTYQLYGGVRLALFTSTPTRGAPGTEPSGGYGRVNLAPLSVSGGVVRLGASVVFGPATSTWNVTHYGVFSADGEYVGYGPLAATVTSSNVLRVNGFVVGHGLLPELVFCPSQPVVGYFPDVGADPRTFTVRITSGGQPVAAAQQVTAFVMDGPVAKNTVRLSFGPAVGWPVIDGVAIYAGSGKRVSFGLAQGYTVPNGRRLVFPEGALGVRLR